MYGVCIEWFLRVSVLFGVRLGWLWWLVSKEVWRSVIWSRGSSDDVVVRK